MIFPKLSLSNLLVGIESTTIHPGIWSSMSFLKSSKAFKIWSGSASFRLTLLVPTCRITVCIYVRKRATIRWVVEVYTPALFLKKIKVPFSWRIFKSFLCFR